MFFSISPYYFNFILIEVRRWIWSMNFLYLPNLFIEYMNFKLNIYLYRSVCLL